MTGMKFKLYHTWMETWDGSDATAGEFGYGDYCKHREAEVATIQAGTKREAQLMAKKIFIEKGIGKALFSGVCATAYLEECAEG